MIRSSRFIAVLTVAGVLATASLAAAQGAIPAFQGRAGKWEFMLEPQYIGSNSYDLSGGTKIDTSADLGFGFGFGYNVSNNLAWHLNTNWTFMNYEATLATVDKVTQAPGTAKTSGTLDTGTVAFDMTYYLLKGPVTPFVMGGVGWTMVDSNISSGPPQNYCWYDPWYGYVCDSYQTTYAKDFFSYNAGAGVRWDVVPGFFLRGYVGMQWVDTDNGTIDTTGGRVDIGFMF
jgi:hypothetical protein